VGLALQGLAVVVAVQMTHLQLEMVRLVEAMVAVILALVDTQLLTQALAVVLVAVVLLEAEMVALVL
jgi:hypothetical protein